MQICKQFSRINFVTKTNEQLIVTISFKIEAELGQFGISHDLFNFNCSKYHMISGNGSFNLNST